MSNSSSDDQNEWLFAVQGVRPIKSQPLVEKPKPRVRKLERDLIFTHDLHGLTVDDAYRHVRQLVSESYEYGIGELRIITGKSGRIAREFASWMNTRHFQQYVRGVSLEHGGGSFIVYLLPR
jgi:DNA-nicking Smr family endonuclease